jgi:hypothetical protein
MNRFLLPQGIFVPSMGFVQKNAAFTPFFTISKPTIFTTAISSEHLNYIGQS